MLILAFLPAVHVLLLECEHTAPSLAPVRTGRIALAARADARCRGSHCHAATARLQEYPAVHATGAEMQALKLMMKGCCRYIS